MPAGQTRGPAFLTQLMYLFAGVTYEIDLSSANGPDPRERIRAGIRRYLTAGAQRRGGAGGVADECRRPVSSPAARRTRRQ
ncbi:hypothetical protein Psi02_72390 [Planotetraspora silvatica]|uniref:Uncharacterized protein n=1 Tax=Planotetraspora silvatica TaxID=234614 RepID=A0A8J3UU88_9ACTN|nr:hypothetical protein Psi02_72390 [Planotetraspora silvatica]